MKPPARHPCEYAPSGGAPSWAWITCFAIWLPLSDSGGDPPGPALRVHVPPSGAQPARGHLPDGLDPAAPDPDDLVGEVAAGAGVERVEAQLLAEGDGGAVRRAAHAVLLGQPLDHHPAIG